MTHKNTAKITAIIFFVLWIGILYAGADHPPPPGFILIIIFDLGASLILYFRVLVYSDCTAIIHYDPALKPGDTLSPCATYTAVPGGQAVTPIGEAFLINGKLTPFAVWDGSETIIELQ